MLLDSVWDTQDGAFNAAEAICQSPEEFAMCQVWELELNSKAHNVLLFEKIVGEDV